MAKIECKEAVTVVDTCVNGVRYLCGLSSISPAGAIANIRTSCIRNIAFQQFTTIFAESFHCPFTTAIDFIYRGISSQEYIIQMVGITVVFIVRSSPFGVINRSIIFRTGPVYSRSIIRRVPSAYINSKVYFGIDRLDFLACFHSHNHHNGNGPE